MSVASCNTFATLLQTAEAVDLYGFSPVSYIYNAIMHKYIYIGERGIYIGGISLCIYMSFVGKVANGVLISATYSMPAT